MKFKIYNLHNYSKIPQLQYLSEQHKFEIEVVGNILPFRTNNYVVNELIDWQNYKDDPIFILNFPNREMLHDEYFGQMSDAIRFNKNLSERTRIANSIRYKLNPNPAGQQQQNIPELDGNSVIGIQHKYRETILFFPSQGQTCHAYCTFCFRWPQFTGIEELKFALKQGDILLKYLRVHKEVTDILITGGDPMVMNCKYLEEYILPLLEPGFEHIQNIRIGTKALTYWPHRFTDDQDSADILRLFEKIVKSGKHLAFMAHFNHPRELQTETVQKAIAAIRNTGAIIRTQSPVLNHINADAKLWIEMWKKQVSLGLIPYYYFIVRNTGAQEYFAVPLVKTWEIFREAYSQVSGISRTVRGPIMSASPGKVQILGTTVINNEKYFALTFLQGRNPKWTGQPFFAKFDENAIWFDDLKPAFGEEKFHFEDEYKAFLQNPITSNRKFWHPHHLSCCE